MLPNRPKGRGGSGACPGRSPRGTAKGRCGCLYGAAYELPVHLLADAHAPAMKTLTLCAIALISTLLFAQEPSSQGLTMPVARVVTDLQGRKLEGTITGKTATEVAFTRTDGQKFTIKLDTLSEGDQAFIAGLTAPDPKAVKKPTVLIVSDGIGEKEKAAIKWLETAGFEVTMGHLYRRTKTGSWPEKLGEWTPDANRTWLEEKVKQYSGKNIIVDPVTRTDPYDIVWIADFRQETQSGLQSKLEVSAYRTSKNRIIVAGTGIKKAQTRYLEGPVKESNSEGSGMSESDMINYVKVNGNCLFYDASQPARSNKKSITPDQVFDEIGKQLDKMLNR